MLVNQIHNKVQLARRIYFIIIMHNNNLYIIVIPWARKFAKAVSLVQKSLATPMVKITLLLPERFTET